MSEQKCCNSPAAAHTIVLGLGNPWRGDDGVGKAVIDHLLGAGLPDDVTVIDGGTAGLETLLLLEGHRRAIIIDAADMGREPGAWERFTLASAELAAHDLHSRVAVHYAGLAEALALGEALGILPPELVIFGVQPESVGWEPGLSAAVARQIPAVCSAVQRELQPFFT